MKNKIRNYNKKSYIKAALIFIVMALPAMILMVQAQRGYEEKMEILYAVLEQQSEGRV